MYDKVLFPVSFYLLDQTDLMHHGAELADSLGSDIQLLSFTLEDEEKSDREEHRQAFREFAYNIEKEGLEVTRDYRDEPMDYEEVADAITDISSDFDLIIMGHTRIRQSDEERIHTTAEKVINSVSIPVFIIPLSTPRFSGLH